MKKLTATVSLCLALLLGIPTAIAEDTLITSGSLKASFSSWGKPSVEGDWKIIKSEGKRYIELADNFKAKSGPDVKIYLSPKSVNSITGNNATEGSILIKMITDFEGKARIEIPENIDITQYQSLVLHCEEYSKLWGLSAL